MPIAAVEIKYDSWRACGGILLLIGYIEFILGPAWFVTSSDLLFRSIDLSADRMQSFLSDTNCSVTDWLA